MGLCDKPVANPNLQMGGGGVSELMQDVFLDFCF